MISPDDYRLLSDLLKKHSGLALGDGKAYLLESRLPPVATQLGLADLNQLIAMLRGNPSTAAIKAVCDAMTTGETLFFRDTAPFTALEQNLLPDAVQRAKATGRAVKIWCAACSSGQEPYSVAMIVAQNEARLEGVRVDILATDFSSQALARAKEGIYNQFEVQRGLPITHLVKFFRQTPQGYQISEDLKKRVQFRETNLLKPFTDLGSFDIIFCRNVLIYFDPATKKDVLERLAKSMYAGGSLLLGGTESTLGITDSLSRVPGMQASVYRRPGDIVAAKVA